MARQRIKRYPIHMERTVTQKLTLFVDSTNKGSAVATALHEASLEHNALMWEVDHDSMSPPKLSK